MSSSPSSCRSLTLSTLHVQSDDRMEELIVGNEPCTFIAICDVLSGCKSSEALWTKLEDIARSLQVPADVICSITPGLISKTKTYYSLLHEILDVWRGKEATGSTLEKLITVLEQRDLQDCADALRKNFNLAAPTDKKDIASINYEVDFQGSKILLDEILQGLSPENIKILEERFLNHSSKPVLIINDSVPPPLEYYIPRRLTTRSRLDPSFFDKRCEDIITMRNIRLHELATIAKKQGAGLSSTQLKPLLVRFILLEYDQDFDKICKISTAPVHLIDHYGGQFIWVKSHGKISNLQGNLHDVQSELSEEEFILSCVKSSTSPICISDTPGMGKTVLLASIAHRIMEMHPTKFVRFIVLREFIQSINSIKQARDKDLLIDMIAEQWSESEFGRFIIIQLLHSESQVAELMFDGFDEVLASQLEKTKVVLKTISNMPSVRVYVSTRPHMRDDLENTLGVLGYSILAFGESEQINCLTKYWEQANNSADKSRLVRFATKCLQQLNVTMNDFERDIAGIPLQCALLAEVYQEDAIKYSLPESRITDIDLGVVIKITSIFDMYKKLMEMRFARITKRKESIKWKWLRRWAVKSRIKVFTKAHIYAALKLIFPDEAPMFKVNLVLIKKADWFKLYYLGILEKKAVHDPTPRFVHRTFAEYFLGLFFAEMLIVHPDFVKKLIKRSTFLKFFFNTVLRTIRSKENLLDSSKVGKSEPIQSASFYYPVICYFLNSHLNRSFPKREIKNSWTTDTDCLYDVITACIKHDYPYLYSQTLQSKAHQLMLRKDPSRQSYLLILSAKHSGFELFHMIFQLHDDLSDESCAQFTSLFPEFIITPLHVAVERGHFEIANFILNSLEELVINKLKYVVHCCVSGTSNSKKYALSQKVEIIPLLLEKNKNWINETLPDGTTPLLTSNVHVSLLQCLLSLGANLRAKNLANESALHICAKQGNHDGLRYLLESETITVNEMTAKNKDGLTPFVQGLKFGKGLTLPIINLMEDKGMVVEEQLASDGLNYLVCNRNILASELNKGFVEVANYLIEKQSAVISSKEDSPWKLNSIERNLHNILQAIDSNDQLLMELARRRILSDGANEGYLGQSEKLFEMIKESNVENSYELLCVSLVACGQIQPFLLLKSLMKLDNQEIAFVTSPIGLFEFVHSKHGEVVVLRSWDIEMSIVRIRNTIDSDAPIITQMDLDQTISSSNLFIFICKTATRKVVEQLSTLQTKTVCLCKYTLDDLDEYETLVDEFSWNDLSSEFQQELREQMYFEFDLKDDPISKEINKNQTKHILTDILHDISCLKNELLITFIQGRQPKLIKCMLSDSTRYSNYLTNKIFNLIIPDKLFFQGISRDQIKSFAKCGQKIGGVDENFQSLDYLIVENVEQFDLACNTHNFNMHLIVYEEEKLKLVKSQGPTKGLNLFRERSQCGSVSSCYCANFLDYVKVNLFFEHPVSKRSLHYTCSTDIHNVPPKGRDILLLHELMNTEEIFRPILSKLPAAAKADGLFPLRNEVSEDTMMLPDDLMTDIIYRWAQHLHNENDERKKLQQMAVNTLFPESLSNTNTVVENIGGVHNEQTISCSIVPDTLAWYLIAELALKTNAFEFLNLTDLRNKLFLNCVETYPVQVKYSVFDDYFPFGINIIFTISAYNIEMEAFMFQHRQFFHFVELLVKQNNDKAMATFIQQNVPPEHLQKWFYACVQANHFNLLQNIPFYYASSLSLGVPSSVFNSKELVVLAIKYSNISVIQLIVEKFVKETKVYVKDVRLTLKNSENVEISISVLHVAALRGDYSVMRYLLNNFELQSLLSHPDVRNILNFCIVDTHEMFPDEIGERKQVIDLLLFMDPLLLKEKTKTNGTALHVPNIHIDLILHLLKHGLNVHDTDEFSRSILHLCPSYLNEREYDKLFQHLSTTSGDSNIFNSTDNWGKTPFHRAVYYLELLDSTLDMFSSAKVDFNCVDKNGDPVLFYAIELERSTCFLEDLIRHGADIDKRDSNNRTVLHIAARYGNLSALEYLISLGCNVSATDNNNDTPLHIAVESFSPIHEIVEVLVQRGAHVNAVNKAKETPFSIAIRKNKEAKLEDRTVELLKTAGA